LSEFFIYLVYLKPYLLDELEIQRSVPVNTRLVQYAAHNSTLCQTVLTPNTFIDN